jgi:nonsense-mediated mRNA decay protein 3
VGNPDFEDFIQDIEEDPVSRAGVNIYQDKAKMKARLTAVDSDEQDDCVPHVTLQEMLDDLQIGAEDE